MLGSFAHCGERPKALPLETAGARRKYPWGTFEKACAKLLMVNLFNFEYSFAVFKFEFLTADN